MAETRDISPITQAAPPADPTGFTVEEARVQQEVMGRMMMARKLPREIIPAQQRILNECSRLTLAKQATYEYPRGGSKITGPSIRLAEVLARNFGNLDYGFQVLSRRPGSSSVLAFCLDMETNVRASRMFDVAHIREKKEGNTDLTDPRDIYEMEANHAQRRVRACILEIIPGDIVEAAVEQCKETLEANIKTDKETVDLMLSKFDEHSVTQEQIEAFLGNHLSAITSGQMVRLQSIYHSLRDGMAKPEQFFRPTKDGQQEQPKTGVAGLKSTVAAQSQQAPPTPPPPDDPPPGAHGNEDEEPEGGPIVLPVPEKPGRTKGSVVSDWKAYTINFVEAIDASANKKEIEQWLVVNKETLEDCPAPILRQIEEAASNRHQAFVDEGKGLFKQE